MLVVVVRIGAARLASLLALEVEVLGVGASAAVAVVVVVATTVALVLLVDLGVTLIFVSKPCSRMLKWLTYGQLQPCQYLL